MKTARRIYYGPLRAFLFRGFYVMPSVLRFMKKILYISAALAAVLIALYAAAVPDVSGLKKANPKKTSMMEYRTSEWKKAGRKRPVYQVWVPLSNISPYLIKAAVIAEDDKFYSHEGFDFEAIEEALEKNIKAGRLRSGGSTISQQLAKNLYLTPEKTALRKVREAVITWRLESVLTKRRILELYLNVAEWGDGIFGAEAASRHYFGKPAVDLTALEAARLVSVLPNPRRYSPVGDQRFVEKRTEMIFNIMIRRGIVIPEFEEISATDGAESIEPTSAPLGG